MSGVQFEIRVITNNGADEVKEIKTEVNQTAEATDKLNKKFKDAGEAAFTFNNIKSALDGVVSDFNQAIQPGIAFNSSLKDMQAITGVSDDMLGKIGDTARQTAKDFGLDASQGVESYKLYLSQLGPELANTPEALKQMGVDAAILSKQLGGDTAAATEILTTALNQYGIDIKDPIAATKAMGEMMNIMTAAAQEGSAELPQVKSALEQAGMMAKTANVPFSELNSAIQVLDKAGKKGAEGGVAIRNVMAELSQGKFMGNAQLGMLHAAGISVEGLADKSKSFAQRLELLKPIVNDTAAMTMLFGKENVAAGIALVQNTGEITRLTTAITGTNAAAEYADTVMGSFSERMARTNAWFKDLGISIFNATDGFVPFIQIGMGSLQVMTNLAGASKLFSIIASTSVYKSVIAAASGMGTWIASTISATAAQWGLNIAMDANPIGILVLAIGAAIAAIALITTYWDDITGAISTFTKWIWDHSPFKIFIDATDKIFPGFKNAIAGVFDWIGDKFKALFAWFEKAWDWVKKLFGNDGKGIPTDATEAAVKDFAAQAQKEIKIEGVNVQATTDGSSPLDRYDPHAKKGRKKKGDSTLDETGSRITSGGARATVVNLHINKLVEQLLVQTTNLEAGGKEAGRRLLALLLEEINSVQQTPDAV